MIKIFGNSQIRGEIESVADESLKEIFARVGGEKRPKLIQVGGPLGRLLVDGEINISVKDLSNDLIENSISFYDDLVCPVDFMRFMVRFTIRELNIVNDNLKKVYDIVDGMTNGKTELIDLKYLNVLIKDTYTTTAEKLLYKNLAFVLEYFKSEVLAHIKDKFCKNSICRGLFEAQCINACPAHIHIPGFVALMKDKKITEAYKLMRQENPLSSICGSVCARPCELRCRRGEITSTVGVRALQRFISATALESFETEKTLASKGKKVAIVGAGPSGLTTAYYLKRTGYDVTVYEKNNEGGGMLSFGVPSYRLPLKSIRDEIKTIEELGVKIVTNTQIGVDITLDELKKKYDVISLATGTNIGNTIKLDHGNVLPGIEFLKNVRLKNKTDIGKRVLVIGGGDVALDCARTALRLGAEVFSASLETFNLAPASNEEKKHSLQEGVIFKSGYGIDSIVNDNVVLKKCIQVTDDSGRFSPVFEEDFIELENISTIILSIGQRPDLSYLSSDLVSDRGFIKTSRKYQITDQIFASGDIIKPTIVIDAIAQGKEVAIEIDAKLGGSGLYLSDSIEIPEKVLNIRTFDYDIREEKENDIKERVTNFDEVTNVYSVEDALYESDRCMRCDRNSVESLLLGR